jgi:type VI protein secretion system component Hcp
MKWTYCIVGPVCLCLIVSVALGQDLYFAKYEGIPGESDHPDHYDWIDIDTVEWSIFYPGDKGDNTAGGARPSNLLDISEFVISFAYEQSVPKLVEKLLKGGSIPTLEIEVTGIFADTRSTYLRYEFEDVKVIGYNVAGSSNSQDRPIVHLANRAGKVKITYTYIDSSSGAIHGMVETELDLRK